MALQVKQGVVVEYHGYPNQWHARYLLATTTHNEFIIVTPDNDMYDEDFGPASAEVASWRVRPAGGGIPFGLNPAQLYDFPVHPSDAELDALCL